MWRAALPGNIRLMKASVPFFLKKLREEFEARAKRRQGYSLRAYARFLGVQAPSLSSVLNGKRRLAKGDVDRVADKLNLSDMERAQFTKSCRAKSDYLSDSPEVSDIERKLLDSEIHFRIIAEWEHYAILSLLETEGFKSDFNWISRRLGISELRARTCTQNLLDAELVQVEGSQLTLNQAGVTTTTDIPSQAIRKARAQDLEQALIAIDEIDLELRDFSSCTMTINLSDLQDLKLMIGDFRKRLMNRAEARMGHEVYKLSVNFFPLTKLANLKAKQELPKQGRLI